MGRFVMKGWTLGVFLFLVSVPLTSALAQPFGIGAPQPQAGQGPGSLCTAGGRFVFGRISDSSKDQFMLDTVTGRLWRIAERGDIGLYLTRIPYRSEDGTLSPLPEHVPCPGQKEEGKPGQAR